MSQRVPDQIKWLQERGYLLEREDGPAYPRINKADSSQRYFVVLENGDPVCGPGDLAEICEHTRNHPETFPVC